MAKQWQHGSPPPLPPPPAYTPGCGDSSLDPTTHHLKGGVWEQDYGDNRFWLWLLAFTRLAGEMASELTTDYNYHQCIL